MELRPNSMKERHYRWGGSALARVVVLGVYAVALGGCYSARAPEASGLALDPNVEMEPGKPAPDVLADGFDPFEAYAELRGDGDGHHHHHHHHAGHSAGGESPEGEQEVKGTLGAEGSEEANEEPAHEHRHEAPSAEEEQHAH